MVKSKSWHSFTLPAYQALPVRSKFNFRSLGLKQNLNFAIGMTSAHSLNGSWLSLGLGSPTLHKMTLGNWNGHRDTTYGMMAYWELYGSEKFPFLWSKVLFFCTVIFPLSTECCKFQFERIESKEAQVRHYLHKRWRPCCTLAAEFNCSHQFAKMCGNVSCTWIASCNCGGFDISD